MTSIEKIILLIDKGNPYPILAEEALVKHFNELLKYKLIDIIDNKVFLTSKGKEARINGIEKVISQLRDQDELKYFSADLQKKEFKIFQLCFLLCLSLLVLFIVLIISN